jgi:hypothetical protein
MKDRWNAKVITIGGKPAAIVDVTFTRTMIIDADIFEGIIGNLIESNLAEVGDFYEGLKNVPNEMLRFIAIPTAELDEQINLSVFGDIIKKFDTRAYWRIEGSSETGFTGILNLSCIERRFDLSTIDKIQTFGLSIGDINKAVDASVNKGDLSKEQGDAIKAGCEAMGASSMGCQKALEAAAAAKNEKDRQERERQEKQNHEHERNIRETGDRTVGDFGPDFAKDVGGIA